MSVVEWLSQCRTVVVLHAHPDDETLSTGPLLATLSDAGVRVHLVTATRGERGEVAPGSLPKGADSAHLVAARVEEVAKAARLLGVVDHVFLGDPPACLPGRPPRRYQDSGMRWVAQGKAGPADDVEHDSLTSSYLDEEAADLAAYLRAVEAEALLSYDEYGGYLHPDHVRCHEIATQAVSVSGIPLVHILSEAFVTNGQGEWRDYPEHSDRVLAALNCYATQLRATKEGVVHVGGQRQSLPLRVGLRFADDQNRLGSTLGGA